MGFGVWGRVGACVRVERAVGREGRERLRLRRGRGKKTAPGRCTDLVAVPQLACLIGARGGARGDAGTEEARVRREVNFHCGEAAAVEDLAGVDRLDGLLEGIEWSLVWAIRSQGWQWRHKGGCKTWLGCSWSAWHTFNELKLRGADSGALKAAAVANSKNRQIAIIFFASASCSALTFSLL